MIKLLLHKLLILKESIKMQSARKHICKRTFARTRFAQLGYFLASVKESCTQACQAKGKSCDASAIQVIAKQLSLCKRTIEDLGYTPQTGGIYRDDNSGCTYHSGQNGWYQIMDKSRTASPPCDEINQGILRQRVCACKQGIFHISFSKYSFSL